MDFERELPDRLRGSVFELEPDVAALVAGGLAHGRRRVRRRRAVQATAAGTTGAVLAAVALFQPWSAGSGARGGRTLEVAGPSGPSGTPTRAAHASRPGTTVTAHGARPAGPDQVATTPQATLRMLLELLPKNATTTAYGGLAVDDSASAFGNPTERLAELTYTDAGGSSKIWIDVWLRDSRHRPSCPPRPEPHGGCTRQTLADGSVFTLYRTHEYAGTTKGPIEWYATLERRDGMQITIEQNNATTEKAARNSRALPPLTESQLRTILTSPTWRPTVTREYAEQAASLFVPRRPD